MLRTAVIHFHDTRFVSQDDNLGNHKCDVDAQEHNEGNLRLVRMEKSKHLVTQLANFKFP
jgi:hypothetical protein